MKDSKNKALKKLKHNLTIEPHYVPRGSGNNPQGGGQDLHYKIKEWGYSFPSEKDAHKYASSHEVGPQGNIIKRKRK